jgi:hypothetical protein
MTFERSLTRIRPEPLAADGDEWDDPEADDTDEDDPGGDAADDGDSEDDDTA